MKDHKKLHILFAGAEVEPLAKVGGLGDVAGALPQAITELAPDQVEIRLILPFHAVIKQKNPPVGMIGTFPIQTSTGQTDCNLYVTNLGDLTVYLLDNDNINHNSPVYHGDAVLDGRKYAFFSVALLEAMKFLGWHVDILHANDWHTALSVYALKTIYKDDPFFAGTKTLLTVHNLPFNGYGAETAMTDLGFLPSLDPGLPDWSRLTPLPVGLSAADKIVAVSPGYAQEILTPDFGCGLDDYLNAHKKKISGILNGIDTSNWNPSSDSFITQKFSADQIEGKLKNKFELQKEFNLELNPDIPLLTVVSRLDYQKGIGLIFDGVPAMLKRPMQLVLLGTGSSALEARARDLASRYPKNVVSILEYDDVIAHKLYASGDIFLMPSLYEPCGLSQMIAMIYGNIPVARATGGLKDSIIDYRTDPENATGFLFSEKSSEGLVSAINFALQIYANKSVWNQIQQNAMACEFSWTKSASEYLKIYQELAE
ncbi:MAG: glycogen/starch synthase [Anaerolineaceae bacterium]